MPKCSTRFALHSRGFAILRGILRARIHEIATKTAKHLHEHHHPGHSAQRQQRAVRTQQQKGGAQYRTVAESLGQARTKQS